MQLLLYTNIPFIDKYVIIDFLWSKLQTSVLHYITICNVNLCITYLMYFILSVSLGTC